MGEESIMNSVTKVTEVSAPTENKGEQTDISAESSAADTDISVSETTENENVPLEHPDRKSVV